MKRNNQEKRRTRQCLSLGCSNVMPSQVCPIFFLHLSRTVLPVRSTAMLSMQPPWRDFDLLGRRGSSPVLIWKQVAVLEQATLSQLIRNDAFLTERAWTYQYPLKLDQLNLCQPSHRVRILHRTRGIGWGRAFLLVLDHARPWTQQGWSNCWMMPPKPFWWKVKIQDQRGSKWLDKETENQALEKNKHNILSCLDIQFHPFRAWSFCQPTGGHCFYLFFK